MIGFYSLILINVTFYNIYSIKLTKKNFITGPPIRFFLKSGIFRSKIKKIAAKFGIHKKILKKCRQLCEKEQQIQIIFTFLNRNYGMIFEKTAI